MNFGSLEQTSVEGLRLRKVRRYRDRRGLHHERALDAFERCRHSVGVGEVALAYLDALPRPCGGLLRGADQREERVALVQQPLRGCPAYLTGNA